MERNDVRVVESGDGLGLELEALQPLCLMDHPFGQDLERDLTVEPGVDRPPHDAHATGTDLLDEPVALKHLAGAKGHSASFSYSAHPNPASSPFDGQ